MSEGIPQNDEVDRLELDRLVALAADASPPMPRDEKAATRKRPAAKRPAAAIRKRPTAKIDISDEQMIGDEQMSGDEQMMKKYSELT